MATNNHPAHGPVSLDRLHQIREILSKAAAQSDGGNLGYAMADAVKVIDGAIAAFGAEPVGYFYAEKPGDWYQISDGDRVPSHRRIPLYSRPQSSPVVKLPNEFISSEGIVVQIEKLMAVLVVHGIQHERRGNSCRAAMLQGADGKPELTVWYGSMPETNGKTNWTAMLHRKGQHPWEGITIDCSEYPDRVRYEADRMRHLIGELADEPDILAYDADAHSGYVNPGNSPVTQDCWCRTCRPMTMSDMRFVVCPECGNKRCPHANDHKNDCTGSNEPGQEGSAYPAAPQQEVNNV